MLQDLTAVLCQLYKPDHHCAETVWLYLCVSAIIGPGLRDGVDMVWGSEPDWALGLDLTAPMVGSFE